MPTLTSTIGTRITATPRGHRYRTYKNKVQAYFPLGPKRAEALKRADEIRAYLAVNTLGDTRKKFHPNYKVNDTTNDATYAEFISYYRDTVAPVLGHSPKTMDSYISGFGRIIRHHAEQELGCRSGSINYFRMSWFKPSWVDDLRLKMVKGARNAEDQSRKKRTFNTILRNARSLFTDEATILYRRKGWHFKWVRELRAMKQFKRVKTVWTCPSEDVIYDMHLGIQEMEGDMFVAAAFALYAGLRRNEILHVSRDWLVDNGEETRIYVQPHGQFQQKGRPGYTVLPPHVKSEIEIRCETDHPGRFMKRVSTKHMRKLYDELRKLLPSQKPLHELRKLYGAWLTNIYGLWTAQKYLRHESPQVTYDSYADSVMSKEAMGYWGRFPISS